MIAAVHWHLSWRQIVLWQEGKCKVFVSCAHNCISNESNANESRLFIIIFFKIQTVTEQAMGSNSTDGTIIKYKRMTRSRICLCEEAGRLGVRLVSNVYTRDWGREWRGSCLATVRTFLLLDIMRGLTTNGVNTTHTGCMMNNT